MARNDRVERATVATCNDLVLTDDDAADDDAADDDEEDDHLLTLSVIIIVSLSAINVTYSQPLHYPAGNCHPWL